MDDVRTLKKLTDEAPPPSGMTREQMDEFEELARRIAAHKMVLVKDAFGRNLPAIFWRQAIPAAERELAQRQAEL